MFGPGQLVSTLLPTIFHSPPHFFPAFHGRLGGSPPPPPPPPGHLLFPGPFISYESLRRYLQPEPGKAEAFLLASRAAAAVAMQGHLTDGIGEPPFPNYRRHPLTSLQNQACSHCLQTGRQHNNTHK